MPAKFSLEQGLRPCWSQCSRKKTRKLAVLLGVSWEPRPIRGWVASLFCVKTRGVGRRDFVTLTRVLCLRKQCKVREFFLWPRPAKSTRWLIIITLKAEQSRAWGSDWLVISFMGGEGEQWLLGLDRLETQYKHLAWKPDRYIHIYVFWRSRCYHRLVCLGFLLSLNTKLNIPSEEVWKVLA